MTNFDDLPFEEKIKIINETAEKFAEAAKPVVERLIKVFQEFSRAVAKSANSILTDDFRRLYMAEIKKERHRRSYKRMIARRQ